MLYVDSVRGSPFVNGSHPLMPAAGIDGCPGGWLVVHDSARGLDAFVSPSIAMALAALPPNTTVGIDIPIGIPEQGVRQCDVEVRQLLGERASSVFPTPLRIVLSVTDYVEANRLQRTMGRGLTRQSFGILPRIREVDAWIRRNSGLGPTLHEGHPELCFAVWNGDRPMAQPKRSPGGKVHRWKLIDAEFPGARARLTGVLRPASGSSAFAEDDLCDAIAALWSARRIACGAHVTVPHVLQRDVYGLPMQIKG